jgi:hypothetical protein
MHWFKYASISLREVGNLKSEDVSAVITEK